MSGERNVRSQSLRETLSHAPTGTSKNNTININRAMKRIRTEMLSILAPLAAHDSTGAAQTKPRG